MKGGIESPAKGTYILLIEIPRGVRMKIGALGALEFPRGFYAYCGSAMGGLGVRINRHLRRRKKIWWHIDYLLEEGRVKSVIYAPTHERLECQLAQKLEKVFHSFPGFGSSDCRCPSHLFFSEELQGLQEKAVEDFRELLKGGEIMIEKC
jgi:sugar fermentation stimulation protein A